VSFGGLLRDPVTSKELSGIARRWQTYAVRGIYVGLFGIIVWNLSSHFNSEVDDRFSQSVLAHLGRKIFGTFLPLQLILVLLSSISSASDLVTKEVRLGTLGLLVSTPLTPWQVALGKWKAAALQGLTLLLCGAPILAICSALGGATPRDILCVTVLSAACAALAAALSLYCSALFRTGTTALLTATVVFAVYLFLPVLVWDPSDFRTPEFVLVGQAHLLMALDGSLRHPPVPEMEDSWIPATAISAGLALLFVRLTAARIATLAVQTPAAPLVTRAFERLDRFYEGIGPEKIRRLRFFADSGGVWDSGAILWKELRTRASGRLRNSVRIALVLLMVLAFSLNLELDQLWIPALATTILFWFLALANGASLFVKEKEERKWDLLLATPLGSGQILAAKLGAGIVPVLPMAATLTLFWSVQMATGLLWMEDFAAAAACVAFPAVLTYLVGAACSLKARTLRGAFILALGLVLGMLVFVPWLLSELRQPQGDHYDEVERFTLDPVRLLLAISSHPRGVGSYWDLSRTVSDDSWTLAAVHVLLSGLILAYLFLRFDRVTGRSE
jgi:ABC-type transport system involved in multi-copper enzyme maturation permease subunit